MSGSEFEKTANAVASQSFASRLGRSEAPTASEPKQETAGSGPYKPFGFLPTNGVGETCDIQGWMENSDTPQGVELQYRFLLQIEYVGEEQIKLYLPDCIVVIDGMYLRDLRKKLARRQVTFIQQYSPRVWPQAPGKCETFIEKISVMRPSQQEHTRGRNS